MPQGFNLLDEPWIRVNRLDGRPDELSLLEVFRQADRIEGIHGEIPSQDAAVERFLLAICHRVMAGPEELGDWEAYWNDPDRLMADACEYLEHFRDRFDLRDPDRPFFQVAGIHAASGRISGLEALIADVPNGRPFFTSRIGPGLERISWAEAARWTIHVHAFDPSGIRSGAVGDPQVKGGKGYPIGTGWAGQLGVIRTTGTSLVRTLMQNTVVCSGLDGLQGVDPELDLPPWERDPDGPAGSSSREPAGPVSCYTWQSRRLLLHGDEDGVTGLFLGNGDRLTPQNRFVVEPMTAWRYSEPQTRKLRATAFMPRKLPTDRALWRGLSSLIAQLSPAVSMKGAGDFARFRPPATIEFYRLLMSEGIVPESGLVPVHATGIEYGSNESVVDELVDDVLVVPAQVLDPANRRAAAIVKDAMEETESVAQAVRSLAANLDRAAGGDPDTVSSARDRAGSRFYQVIDERFPRWLAALGHKDFDSARDEWRQVLRDEAHQQEERLCAEAPLTAFSGRGDGPARIDLGQALVYFRSAMAKALPAPDSTHERPAQDAVGERTAS